MSKAILIMLVSLNFFSFGTGQEIDYNDKLIARILNKYGDAIEMHEVLSGDLAETHNEMGKFFSLSGNNLKDEIAYLYVGRVNSCRSGGCSLSLENSGNEYEYFDYFILYDSSGEIKHVRVFNYQATKGQEITSLGWLKQFVSFNGSNELTVGKQIDGISGATISVHSITADIQYRTIILGKIINPDKS